MTKKRNVAPKENEKVTRGSDELYIKTPGKVTKEDLELIFKIVSPAPKLDENGKLQLDDKKEVIMDEATEDEIAKFNAEIKDKSVTVGDVISITSMFSRVVRNFTIQNLQGLSDSLYIQQAIIEKLAGSPKRAKRLTDEAIKEFENKDIEKEQEDFKRGVESLIEEAAAKDSK